MKLALDRCSEINKYPLGEDVLINSGTGQDLKALTCHQNNSCPIFNSSGKVNGGATFLTESSRDEFKDSSAELYCTFCWLLLPVPNVSPKTGRFDAAIGSDPMNNGR